METKTVEQEQKQINPLYLPGLTEKTTDDILYPELSKIAQAVTNYFNTSMRKLRMKQRHRTIVQPRQIGMYLSNIMTKHSLTRIGSYWGGFDHATVLHACKTVLNLYDTSRHFRVDIDYLYNELCRYFKEDTKEVYSYTIHKREKKVELYISASFDYSSMQQLMKELQEEEITKDYIIDIL